MCYAGFVPLFQFTPLVRGATSFAEAFAWFDVSIHAPRARGDVPGGWVSECPSFNSRPSCEGRHQFRDATEL